MDLIYGVILSIVFYGIVAVPVTQPVYSNSQYIGAQNLPNVQYRPEPQTYIQPQYASSIAQQQTRPVYEADKGNGLQKYSTQIKQPIQQSALFTTNLNDQIQKLAQTPLYLQHIQAAQQQRQNQSPAKLETPTAQIAQQPHYLTLLQSQPKYTRPVVVASGYRQQQQQQIQQQKQPQQQETEPEDYDPNPSYQFGFDVNDDLYTNYQNRKEQREGNKITGSYSVVDSDGYVRTVTYTADPKEGFKAEVTRQPTDIVVKIPKPDPQFARPTQQYIQDVQAVPKSPNQGGKPAVYQYE